MTPRPQTVAGLVRSQALARPDAVYAIAAQTGRTITFGELDASCRRDGEPD